MTLLLVGTTTELDILADFFRRYGSALTTEDLPAIAGCYALPAMVVADSYSFSFSTPAAVALSFIGAVPEYRERGLVAAHAQLSGVQPLSGGLTMVVVDWEYLDSRGAAIPGESFRYVLRRTPAGHRICVVMPQS